MSDLSAADATRLIEKLLEANGDEVDVMQAQPKGRGVWIAEVYRPATKQREQGIFTDDQLLAAE